MVIGAIVVFGALFYTRLNVDMFPEVNYPIVTVTTIYAGAGPETMESQISDPIEEALNSLSGVESLRSASLEGISQVYVEFEMDIDVGTATQEVRDKLSTVTQDLPPGAETPNVQKLDIGAAPVMQIGISGGDTSKLLTYAEDTLKPSLERINGVGLVNIVGGRSREMHVWLRPEALRGYGITAEEVVGALRTQNLDLPGGRISRGKRELVVRTDAQVRTAPELASLIVATRGQSVVHLRDLARVEDTFEEQRSAADIDGSTAVVLTIQKQSDANTVKVAEAVSTQLPALNASLPDGATLSVLVDNSLSIRASIDTVELDIILGGVLAVLIILLFLRDLRATLISAVALPTSVIGTFIFVNLMGFTLNMMTTLALSLSIGILIDDAIVVIENIVRRRTEYGETPHEAASRGTAEIGLAVLATTLSIVAVFVPVAFMDGLIGQFFFQFGMTVAFAVLLSLFISFTLTPMLASRFLKVHSHAEATGISKWIEAVLVGLERGYRRVIQFALRRRALSMIAATFALIGSCAMVPMLGFEMMPVQDKAQYNVSLELPSGTSLEETIERSEVVAERLRSLPGVESTLLTVGGGALERVNTSLVVVTLTPRSERSFHQLKSMADVRTLLADEESMTVAVEEIAAVSSGERTAAMQLDLRGDDIDAMAATAQRIMQDMQNAGGYVDVDSSFRGGKPEIRVDVDRNRAGDFGIRGAQVATTVRTMLAGDVATQIERDGERYDVRVQLPRSETEIFSGPQPQIRGMTGVLVDLDQVAKVRELEGPASISREARQRQVSIYANLDGSKALNEAMTEVERFAAAQTASEDIQYAFGGNAKRLNETTSSMLFALLLAIGCVYMILASQFESFLHPLTIMASLPFSMIGALGALVLSGMTMSIFAMIGFIMLMGLVTKNAILLVDFAVALRKGGQSINDALENAGAIRLRPILMTTIAMIFGMLPVAIGHGDGGEMRAPMGVAIIGGLISSTLLTLVVVPVIYSLLEGAKMRVSRRLGQLGTTKPKEEAA
jgi:hydrophobe/amphiphile efflux-1 (HAE1) family protein